MRQRVVVDEDRGRVRRDALAAFLRSRIARMDAAAAGAGTGSRRRVPGLRREEVAWERQEVASPAQRIKRYRHPDVGDMTFESTTGGAVVARRQLRLD